MECIVIQPQWNNRGIVWEKQLGSLSQAIAMSWKCMQLILNWTPWFCSPTSSINHLSPRQENFQQIASVTLVITGNSRLLMPNVPITSWYVTPSLSYREYFLSLAVSSFYYCLNPSLIPSESLSLLSLCISLFSAFPKALWFKPVWLKLERGEDRGTSVVANRKSSFFCFF